jgi:hypothetical protein
MTAIANLLGSRSAELLAAARAEAEQRERHALEAAPATPVQPVCPTCGQRRPAPLVVFSSAP